MRAMKGAAFALALALMVCLAPAAAQEKTPAQEETPTRCKRTADVSLALNQTGYSSSWQGAETGALTWTLAANLEGERTLSANFNWKNTLKLTFGQQHSQVTEASGERSWLSPTKASDRIFFESLLRGTMGWHVDPFAALVFESQFYDPSIPDTLYVDGVPTATRDIHGIPKPKRYINPITLTESAGIGRILAKSEQTELYARLGLALRQHIARNVVGVNDEQTEYATESETTTDGGLEWVTDYSRTFGGERLKYVSKLRVFQALFSSEEDEYRCDENSTEACRCIEKGDEDCWKAPDVAWENTLSASVSQYVQVSLFFEVLYDKEIDLRGRFREILGLGIAYKLY